MVHVDVTVDIVINRPRHEVAAYVCDPDNVTAWYPNIKAVRWESAKPARLGSRFAFTAKFLGRELNYTYEVVEFEGDQRFVMRTAAGPFPMETSYMWEDAGAGSTKMTLRNRGEPSGFAKIAASAIKLAMRRANTKDLARLKAILEGAADQTR